MTSHLGGLPEGLTRALEQRQATITRRWQEGARIYAEAEAPDAHLFARCSTDPSDVAILAHEAQVRALIGDRGVLRAPPVLEAGRNWLLEVAVRRDEQDDRAAAEAVVAAAGELARLELPSGPGGAPPGVLARLRRRFAWSRSKVSVSDLLQARKLIAASTLPRVTSHGDFHHGNVLVSSGSCWVIDWELTGRRPAGYDLMHYWTGASEEQREAVFEGAVRLVGPAARSELLRIRYAVTVQTIVGMLANTNDFDRDVSRGEALLGLLPVLRREAALPT